LQTLAVTGGVGPYSWSASGLPGGLTLSAGGVLSGTPTAAGTVTFPVSVTDVYGGTANKNFSLTIIAAPVITTGSELPTGEISVPYSQTLGVTGGTSPYSWTVESGVLPGGLILTGGGVITGVPTVSGGPFIVTIRVTDNRGAFNIAVFTLNMVSNPVITTGPGLPGGEVGLPYSITLTVTGGLGPYTWTTPSANWPAGLSLSGGGVLSGTPAAAAGPVNVTVRVTDSLNMGVNAVVNITIFEALAISTESPLARGEINIAYSQGLTVTGGASPYTWV